MAKSQYSAYREEFNKYTIITPKSYYNGENAPFVIKDPLNNKYYELIIQEKIDLGDRIKYVLSLQGFIELGRDYYVIDKYNEMSYLMLGYLCRTKEFNKRYTYDGDDLGSVYNDGKLTFKVWTPTATQVRLVVYETASIRYHNMNRNDDGVWSITIPHPDESKMLKYKYEIINNLYAKETTDPYAKLSTVNGEYSIACNFNDLVTPLRRSKCPKLEKPTDAIIYEVSIRDMTKEGTYESFIKCIPYLKELGITHIQIMPFYDFEGVDEINPTTAYNWGYNPSQFMVPEGSFSADPGNPIDRIEELQDMIAELHEAGIGVIMDSVYNHVYNRDTHPFDALVPTYFFRYDHMGMATNGSGCGNDVASERRMVRKYILDSIEYWLKYFAIDGFRFDLMGLLDVTTINKVRRLCDKYDKGILLYGEGWDMNTALPHQEKANANNHCRMNGISFFNDTFRDYIKGNSFNVYDRGLALGRNFSSYSHQQLLAGSTGLALGETFKFFSPTQSINYVSCHDNMILWDKLKVAIGHKDEEEIKKRQILCLAMVILSQGIPFLHCGDEFMRTKKGIENSYNSSDEINKVDWSLREENEKYVEQVKELIKLRKSHGAFRFDNSYDIKQHLNIYKHYDSVIEYHLTNVGDYGPYNEIIVYFNTQNYKFELPVNGQGMHKLDSDEIVEKIELDGVGTTVLVR